MRLMQSTAIVGLALLTSCGGDSASGGGTGVVPAPTPSPSPAPSPTPAPSPSPKPTGGPSTVVDFSFANDTAGWSAGFADYTPGQEGSIGFNAAETQLPSPLPNQMGFALSGNNVSNDLFMYIWKPVTGLSPSTRYQVAFSITFATNAPPGCAGSPGENVWIKAGATNVQPANVTQNGRVTVNFDKGNQGTGGANAVVLGTFAQGTPGGDCNAPSYQSKTLTSGANGPFVTSDANGKVWLVVGTDSGFSGTTKIYYISGEATLSPAGS